MIINIILYNLSLLPLYIIYFIKLIFFKSYEVNVYKWHIKLLIPYCDYRGYLFLIFILISFVSLIIIKNNFLNRGYIIDNITHIIKKEYEYFTFLSVFILPLFGVDIKGMKDLVVLFFIVVFMGYIYIKGNFLYLNPIYLIFGWYLYEGNYKGNKIIFLSNESEIQTKVEKGYIIKQISKNFYFVKRLKNGKR